MSRGNSTRKGKTDKKSNPKATGSRRDRGFKKEEAGKGTSTKKEGKSSDKFSKTDKKFEPRKFEKKKFDSSDKKKEFPDAKKPFIKKRREEDTRKPFIKKRREDDALPNESNNSGLIRLNKYIANSGICSRREADKLIISGAVKINGKVIVELGTKVEPTDEIIVGGERIKNERHVYLLLNKPKDYITTSKDPEDRKTVLHLIEGACKERVYPVGRLDRKTTGVLLITNDGDLTKKLTHPSSQISKLYHVTVDKNVTSEDMKKLITGVELEDGMVKADYVEHVEVAGSKKEIGIELHSGKNRVIRRMMEALGYDVVKLDRVLFAGLTKKNLPKGHWRFLTSNEISFLKMLPSQKSNPPKITRNKKDKD